MCGIAPWITPAEEAKLPTGVVLPFSKVDDDNLFPQVIEGEIGALHIDNAADAEFCGTNGGCRSRRGIDFIHL
jgi:hypothetical protein